MTEPCRFGYEEYDGARYCHEHGDFLEAGDWYRKISTCPKYREAQAAKAGQL